MAKTQEKPKTIYKIGDYVRRDTKEGIGYLPNLYRCPYCKRSNFRVLISHDALCCAGCSRVVRFLSEKESAQIKKIKEQLAEANEKIKNLQGLLDIATAPQEPKPNGLSADIRPNSLSPPGHKEKACSKYNRNRGDPDVFPALGRHFLDRLIDLDQENDTE